jgi:NitT/TauT family transport system permease protein
MRTAARYLPLVLLLAAWEAASRLGLVPQSLLPSLSGVLALWWRLLVDGELLVHGGASLWRTAAGLGLSIVVGTALGILMAWSRPVRRALQPLVSILYPLPKSALIPILMIWLGIGHMAKIAVIFMGCLLPVVLGSFNGANGVDRTLIWSAQSLGAGRRAVLREIVLPAALPDILSGIRIALALSFVLLVSSEMLAAREGLGFLVSFLGEAGNYEGMFAAVFTVTAIGFAADRAYLAGMRRALRWREV